MGKTFNKLPVSHSSGDKVHKVVFHVDMDNTPVFELTLVNIENFLADKGDAEVALLANGSAVKLFVRAANKGLRDRLEKLHEEGVKIFVCNNALSGHTISKEDIFDFCEIVPAGVTKLVELQQAGYAYIKP